MPNSKTRILIVEDEVFLREIYSHVFSKAGYEIELAHDGVEGVEKAESGSYDLILLDILMPRMNGIETLKKLRKPDSKALKIPILLLTNLGQETIIREAYRIGANGFILKADLLPRQVMKKVRDFLDGKLTKEDFLPSRSTE